MAKIQLFKDLFRRHRRPGDLVFALAFLALSLILVWQLPAQTVWVKRTQWFGQPSLWPMIATGGMLLFSLLHALGSLVSDRIPGRGREVLFWLRALEFVLYFLIYVVAVPVIGYLPATLLFTFFLTLRAGFHSGKALALSAAFALVTVVVFRGLLHVKIPSGLIYEHLPSSLRSFAMLYL